MFLRLEIGRWLVSVSNNLVDKPEDEEAEDEEEDRGAPAHTSYPQEVYVNRPGFRILGDYGAIATDI